MLENAGADTERYYGVTEGACQSGASIECEAGLPGGIPNPGVWRILPESMLPGSERAAMYQCLACYEASAEAYVRKLHRSGM